MQILSAAGTLIEQNADTLIVTLFEGATELSGATAQVDAALAGALTELLTAGDMSGKANAVTVVYPRGAIAAQRVLVVGLGKREKLSLDVVRLASAVAVDKARSLGARQVAASVRGLDNAGAEADAQAIAEGAGLTDYQFQKANPKDDGKRIATLTVVALAAEQAEAVARGVQAGATIAASVNFARDLVNQPPNVCTPEYLAAQAAQMAGEVGLSYQALLPEEMRALGMGALLAVAQASVLPPRFIILEHRPAGTENIAPLVLVGKGVTFDTGGLSIKTADGMVSMKGDMGGGAAVLGAMRAIAALKVARPVIGLVPTSENVIGSAGYRPSDVIRASNGKTIEIISTDAEGRLLLADALVYAKQYNPVGVVDIATLTGACAIALGELAAGLFGSDDAIIEQVRRAATQTGERVWPLPLYEEYRERINSDVADMKNSAGNRFSGVGVSAAFLKEFAEGYAWAHIDMAGMEFFEKAKGPFTRGATGYGVRLLTELARGWK